MEISNKSLVWLVVATIVVSMFGTILSVQRIKDNRGLTAYATSNDTGTASVTISSTTVLDFAISSLNFGSGSVNTSFPATNCTLISGVSAVSKLVAGHCIGFTTTGNPGLVLENDGNTYMSVTLNFSVNESSLFAGTTAARRAFHYNFSSNETNSCIGVTNSSNTTGWVNVPLANTTVSVCSNLSWIDADDSLFVGLRISIPDDADGAKAISIMAQGTNI